MTTVESDLLPFADSIVVSSCAPINATTITASPTTNAGVNNRIAIQVASGNPVLTRADKSEVGAVSLILKTQTGVSGMNISFFLGT